MADLFNLKRFNLQSGDVTVRNSFISLGGRTVTDVIPGANILDIRIGAATIKQITSDRGYRSGSDYVRRRHTTRRIEVDIELPLDRETYPDNVNLIRRGPIRRNPSSFCCLRTANGRSMFPAPVSTTSRRKAGGCL